jgi:hypothetical protein
LGVKEAGAGAVEASAVEPSACKRYAR